MKKKILIFLMIFLLLPIHYVKANNWLEGWQYRKMHKIQGSTSGEVTDYQIKIIVYYGNGTDIDNKVYLNKKVQDDFEDVRFTDEDGTILSYWLEKKKDKDYAIFWVKIPYIPQYPDNATIYVYYGNFEAEMQSNGTATFVRFDDFEDYSDDEPPKEEKGWSTTNVDPYNYWKVITYNYNKVLYGKESGDGYSTYLIMQIPEAKPYVIHYNIYAPEGGREEFFEFYEDDTYIAWHSSGSGSSYTDVLWWDGSQRQEFDPPLDITRDEWNEFNVKITPTIFNITLNNEEGEGDVFGTATNGINIWRTQLLKTVSQWIYLDNFYIRNYINPEPTHVFWGEEEKKPEIEQGIDLSIASIIAIVISMMIVLIIGGRD